MGFSTPAVQHKTNAQLTNRAIQSRLMMTVERLLSNSRVLVSLAHRFLPSKDLVSTYHYVVPALGGIEESQASSISRLYIGRGDVIQTYVCKEFVM